MCPTPLSRTAARIPVAARRKTSVHSGASARQRTNRSSQYKASSGIANQIKVEKTGQETGADFVAIPHNGAVSNGQMFSRLSFDGKPLSAGLANMRARWEPIYEVTQIKGDSETHPILSPDDEFADFETYAHALDAAAAAKGGEVAVTVKDGDYARQALRTGLELEDTTPRAATEAGKEAEPAGASVEEPPPVPARAAPSR